MDERLLGIIQSAALMSSGLFGAIVALVVVIGIAGVAIVLVATKNKN